MGAPIRRKKHLFDLKHYKTYCLRYRYNFLKFVCEVSGKTPTWQQIPIIEAMSKSNFNVSVVSGHGTGKSWLYGWFCIWHLTVFPYSNLLLTSNNVTQLRKVVWKEIADGLERLEQVFPWIKGYFIRQAKNFYAKGYPDSWYCIPATAPKGSPESLAGQHRDKYTVLCDEASRLPDDLIDVLQGALTGKDNSFAMVSQPTRTVGRFYDSHHSQRDLYTTFQLDSELSPLVSKKWIEKHLLKYGGFLSRDYQIKVRGLFAGESSGMLIPRPFVEMCFEEDVIHEEAPGIVIAVDISGHGRDSTVILVAKVSNHDERRRLTIEELIVAKGINKAPDVVGLIKVTYQKYKDLDPIIGIDSDGLGATHTDYIERAKLPVEYIYSGKKAYDTEKYLNRRAETAFWLREAVFYNQISFKGIQDKRVKDQLIEEFSNVPYKPLESGKYKLVGKPEMRKMGIKSPDIFDAFRFAMSLDYVVSDVMEVEDDYKATARIKAREEMKKLKEKMNKAKEEVEP